jgi:hypothetical protein
MSNIYYCTQENNTCLKKDDCKRYVESDGKPNATLFKVACTEDNNYILFIKAETEKEIEE